MGKNIISKTERNKIILDNQKLVHKIVWKYINSNVEREDLIQEGNIALMNAIKNYKPELGCQFSTFASYYIEYAILKFIQEQKNIVKVTEYARGKTAKYINAYIELTSKLDREPTILEISEYSGISIDVLEKLIQAQTPYASLDYAIEQDENLKIKKINNVEEKSIEEIFDKKEMVSEFYKLIENACLTEIQLKVLVLKYGLYGYKKRTIEEICKILGKMSRGSINAIEKQALKKIKNCNTVDNLRIYFNFYKTKN